MRAHSLVSFNVVCFSCLLPLMIAGCATGTKQLAPSQVPVAISQQPASATIPINSTGTFTVAAYGDPPLSYQWRRNGVPIEGATSTSYTTPAVDMCNNDDKYTVVVSNSAGSVTSTAATVTIGPRSPEPGDIRFKLVGSGVKFTGSGLGQLGLNLQPTIANGYATPFEIGDQICNGDQPVPDCDWAFDTLSVSPQVMPLTASARANFLANYESDLAALNTPDSVVQMIDLRPGDGVFGLEVLQLQGGQFDLIEHVIAPGAIASTVASDAAQSRVMTAVSFDASGQAHLMSYGWTGDTSTLYDTDVSIVAPQDVASSAQTLGSEGFVITAFGGDDTNGYVLVGTKVHGDTLPRPIQIYPGPQVPGTWIPVASLSWLEYSSSGSIANQGNATISEE